MKSLIVSKSIKVQQSHHCGIETCEQKRTDIHEVLQGSNRTIVGLKLGSGHEGRGKSLRQQSHHCGIETFDCILNRGFKGVGSNRTIVGLKLDTVIKPSYVRSSSNRTIVGLKL